VKEECLSRLVLFGEAPLRRALAHYEQHPHAEHPHQGKGNGVLLPQQDWKSGDHGTVCCRERLGGLLKYYYRKAG
jgi:hypothetical protein